MGNTTTVRYWRSPLDPTAVAVETTATRDSDGAVLSVSNAMQSDSVLITEAEYDAAVAAQATSPDLRAASIAVMASDRASIAADALVAYDELVAAGYTSTTASVLSGHTP